MKDDDIRHMNPCEGYGDYPENAGYYNGADGYYDRNGYSSDYPYRGEPGPDPRTARYDSDGGYPSDSPRVAPPFRPSASASGPDDPREPDAYVPRERDRERDRERELKRAYLNVTNKVVNQYFPYKTISVDREFDCFRHIFFEELQADPRFASISEDSLSDAQLKNLFFIVGGTLLGHFKPREERLARLAELGIDPTVRPVVEPEKEPEPEYFEQKNADAYDERMSGYDEYEEEERAPDYEERRYPIDRPQYGSDYQEETRRDDYYDYGATDDRRGMNARRPDYRYNAPAEGDWETPNRANALNQYAAPAPSPAPAPAPTPRPTPRPAAGQAQGLRAFMNRNSSSLAGDNAPASVEGFELIDIVNYFRRCLDAYFPERLVVGEYDLIMLEKLLSFLCPKLKLERKDLPRYISYAGGTYRADNVRLYTKEEVESRETPSLEEFEESLNGHQDKALLVGVFTFVEKNFPNFLVDPGTEGLGRCYQEFSYLPRNMVDMLVTNAHGLIGKLTPTEEDAYVVVSKKVLRDRFYGYKFKRDFSDFGPFAARFKELAGPGANPSESQLQKAFVNAGARFVAAPVVEETPAGPVFSRPTVVKKVVASEFPCGLRGDSSEDLELFRRAALKYNVSFDDESDARLLAIISRSCVNYKDRLYSAPEKDKDELKKIVREQFRSGARIIFYRSLFDHEKDLLTNANITSPELLNMFLAKFYSTFLFYEEYLERDQCDESERAKVEREILRVWNRAGDLKNGAKISQFVYIPSDRIDKALALNTELFYATDQKDEQGNVLYGRKESTLSASQLSALEEEWDELYEAAFGSETAETEEEAVEKAGTKKSLLDYAQSEDDDPSETDYYASLPTDAEWDQDEESAVDEEEEEEVDNEEESDEEYDDEEVEDSEDEEEEEEDDEEYEEPNVEWTPKAIALIKRKVDDWFDEGGVMIYVDALLDKCEPELAELGFEDVDVVALLHLVANEYPEYYFAEEGYFTPEADELTEVEKIKLELDRVWKADQAARRIVELVDLTYLSKDALFENVENLGVEKRSNGYLVRKPKRIEGARRTKKVLKPRRRSSKR